MPFWKKDSPQTKNSADWDLAEHNLNQKFNKGYTPQFFSEQIEIENILDKATFGSEFRNTFSDAKSNLVLENLKKVNLKQITEQTGQPAIVDFIIPTEKKQDWKIKVETLLGKSIESVKANKNVAQNQIIASKQEESFLKVMSELFLTRTFLKPVTIGSVAIIGTAVLDEFIPAQNLDLALLGSGLLTMAVSFYSEFRREKTTSEKSDKQSN